MLPSHLKWLWPPTFFGLRFGGEFPHQTSEPFRGRAHVHGQIPCPDIGQGSAPLFSANRFGTSLTVDFLQASDISRLALSGLSIIKLSSGMAFRSGAFARPSTEELREQIYRRMRQCGATMVGQDLWTDEEIQILREVGPRYDILMQKLKGRTYEAIRHKCNRLGLTKTLHIWSAAEIMKLRRLYPTAPKEQLIATFPFSNWSRIKSAARNREIRRERPNPKSDCPMMNAIIDRCAAIRWSLKDLDDACDTGRYFRSCQLKKRSPNINKLLKAVAMLEGTVSVIWSE